jgi:hypothetical protein
MIKKKKKERKRNYNGRTKPYPKVMKKMGKNEKKKES